MLTCVLVAFALTVPAAEATMRFFNWCMFSFSDVR